MSPNLRARLHKLSASIVLTSILWQNVPPMLRPYTPVAIPVQAQASGDQELDPNNNEIYTVATGRPELGIVAFVNRQITNHQFPYQQIKVTVPRGAILMGTSTNWIYRDSLYHIQRDTATLQAVCDLAGYREVASADCVGNEGGHICNFTSPSDNTLWTFSGNNFVSGPATPQFQKAWLSSLSCRGRLPQCDNGLDDDQDGKADFAGRDVNNDGDLNDPGDLPRDPNCATPNDDNEGSGGAEAICNDGVDNDADGQTDCSDSDCAGNAACVACSNGIDDDRDGTIDHSSVPQGGGGSSGAGDTELNPNNSETMKFGDRNPVYTYHIVENFMRSYSQQSPRDLLGVDTDGGVG